MKNKGVGKLFQRKLWMVMFLFIGMFFLLLFINTASRWPLNYADSDDLILAIVNRGLAHPPGYPYLVLMFNWVVKVFSDYNAVLVINVTGAVVGMIAMVGFAMMMKVILKSVFGRESISQLLAVLWGTLMLGTSWYVWTHSVVIEVFVLEMFLLSMFTLSFFKYLRGKNKDWMKVEILACVLFGAFAMHHHQLGIPWVIFTILWGGYYRWGKLREIVIKILVPTMIFFGLLFLVYWLVDFQSANYSWPMNKSFEGVAEFFLRQTYATGGSQIETLVNEWSVDLIINTYTVLFKYLVSDLGLVWMVMIFSGFYFLTKNKKKWSYWLIGQLVIFGLLMPLYLKFPIRDSSAEIEYFWGTALRIRMYYPLIMLAAMAMIVGVYYISSFLKKKNTNFNWLLFLGLFLVLFVRIVNRYGDFDLSDGDVANVYSRKVLDEVEKDAYLLVNGDMIFSLLTQQEIYEYRRDIKIDTNDIDLVRYGTKVDRVEAELFKLEIEAENIAEKLGNGNKVYLYNPDARLLNLIGVEGNPYYLIPKGYIFELSNNPLELKGEYDYGLSAQLVDYPQGDFDWWMNGFRAHLGTIHAQVTYFLARVGNEEAARAHVTLAKGLSSFESSWRVSSETLDQGQKAHEGLGDYMNYKHESYEDYIEKGNIKLSDDDFDGAEYYFTRALMVSPDRSEARLLLIEMYTEMGRKNERDYHIERLGLK